MTSQLYTLEGKVALITGATSGIGSACAREMSELGARVMLSGRNEERGAACLGALGELGREAAFLAGDVRDAAFCERVVAETCERFGRLDILMNSAGISHAASTLDTTDAQWYETIETNLSGLFFVSRAALRVMRAQGAGAIVHVSSDWGLVGAAQAAAYCASKAGVVALARSMALDHARDGIRVNAICPGDTDTPMMLESYRQLGLSIEAGERASAADIPMGRMATPEEVSHAICFLASDAARFITGAALPIDGGNTAR